LAKNRAKSRKLYIVVISKIHNKFKAKDVNYVNAIISFFCA